MTWGTRRRLRDEYQRKLESVVQDTVNQKADQNLSTAIDELENYSKLIDLTEPKWTPDFAIAVLIALVCISAAAFLWSHKLSRTNITLNAETESLEGSLAQDWNVDAPFRSNFIHIERLSDVQAPNLGLNIKSGVDAWLRFEGGTISIQRLNFARGGLLQISSGTDEVSLYFSRQPLLGIMTVVGKGTLTWNSGTEEQQHRCSYDLPVPEIVNFSVADPRNTPSQITVHQAGKWNFGKVPLGALDFSFEHGRDIGESTFVSGAKSGFIRFEDASWPKFEISENELLSINGTSNADVELRSAERLTHVSLSGTVTDVKVGREGNIKRLAPSYLEYLYQRKALTLFWGAIVFGWGLLWGIRKTIFR